MAVGLATTNLANAWLNTLRGTSFVVSTGTFVRLHTADPLTNGNTAPAAGATTRSQATFAAAASGSISLTGTNPSWTNTVGTNETITHISVWTASTAGLFLFSAALAAPTAWALNDIFVLTSLSVSLAPLAA